MDIATTPIDIILNPFHDPGLNSLSDQELRETVYEIFVGACRGSGSKPLTYIPQSERNLTNRSSSFSAAPSLQNSLTSVAASKVKQALGLKSSKKKGERGSKLEKTRNAATIGELIRVQMRISEQTDTRIRRGLLRIAAGKLGRRFESIVLPLELLQQFRSIDFPTRREYEAWKMRNLKVLEAGLLLYPHLPFEKSDTAPQRLQQMIQEALEKPTETGRYDETMQLLHSSVLSLASRSFDGSVSEMCHWADGCPFNLRLYQLLLEACFDVNEEVIIVEELDEVLEFIKKTWAVLGVNQMLHNLCFAWVLFHRFIATGEIEDDLLFAANNLLAEVEKDTKATKDPDYSKIMSAVLSSFVGWTEKRLFAYRNIFNSDNIEMIQSVVSLGVTASKMMTEVMPIEYHRKTKEVDVACYKVDMYIRSSLCNAFAQKVENVNSTKKLHRNHQNSLPFLAILAQEVSQIAFDEKGIFSSVFKRWHPLPAGVAAATLHACYGNELKKITSGISELTPDAVHVLIAADKLEKDLVQIAVEDAVDSEDGGKSIIRELPPYEAEAVLNNLVKSWIKTRVDRLKEWVDRNLQQEAWNPQANKQRVAPSAIEVLRSIEETLEAFFLLPIPMRPALFSDLMHGLDRCLQCYILKAKSNSGTRNTFIPAMPALTRCTVGLKYQVFKKREKSHISQRRKAKARSNNGGNEKLCGLPQLCVCINTFHLIRVQLDALEKRTIARLRNCEFSYNGILDGSEKKFELSAAACVEGLHQLSEATAYRVVFNDLSHLLWDGLYIGEVSSFRIKPFLLELEQNLEIIATTVHDRVRTRVITDLMKASLDGFLMVLLAGGPSRAFTVQDSAIMEEDFKFVIDLFWSNGDGLPFDLIDKYSTTAKSILPLFRTDTESLIERFRNMILENYGSSAKSRLPLPPTSARWNPNECNTLLRVLCYRNDETATKFLKKTYNLPKKI